MLQSHQIKKEPSDWLVSSDKLKCTCNNTAYAEYSPSKKHRQVLVNFGLNRKKVFTLHGKKDKLHEKFTSYVLSEPAFSELLKDSYVVFQEFNQRFGAWVDIDTKETLRDGAVLNAVFFPIDIERDESNPGSIRRKQKELEFVGQNSAKCRRRPKVIVLDQSDEEAEGKNPVENGDSCKEHEVAQKPKEKKSKKHKKEPDLQNVKKEAPEIKRQRKESQEQTNGEFSNKSQDLAVREGMEESTAVINNQVSSLLPKPTEKSADPNNSQSSRKDYNSPARSKHDPYFQSIRSLEELCAERSWPAPTFSIQQDDENAPFCKVLVNGHTYFAYHKFYSHLKEAAASMALSFLTSNEAMPPYSSPKRESYSPFHNKPHDSLDRGQPHNSSARGQPHNSSARGQHHNSSTRGQHHNSSTRGQHHNSSTRGQQHNSSTRGQQHNSSTRGQQHNSSTRGKPQNSAARGKPHHFFARGGHHSSNYRHRGSFYHKSH